MVKSFKILCLICSFGFFLPTTLYPQPPNTQSLNNVPLTTPWEAYKIEHITEQDGLSHGCISCIIQDGKGFMWFGTEGGLNRYDGYTMKEYVHDPDNPRSISNNFIRTIFEDPADSGKVLWIGTKGGGLNKYDQETDQFTSYQNDPDDPTSLSHNEVKCIFKDKAGTYWIGTEGGGLNQFDRETGKFVLFKNDPNDPSSLSADEVYSICEDHLGYLWIATGGGGLDKFDRKTGQFSHYWFDPNDPESLPSNVVFAVHEDRDGILWIGTKAGLRKYDRQTNRMIRHQCDTGYANNLHYDLIWTIFEDTRGGLWIGDHSNGLFHLTPQRDREFLFESVANDPNSLIGRQISSICEDRSGIIWAGTYCAGITKLIPEPKRFRHYQKIPGDPTSLSHNAVSAICEDSEGFLWVGTRGGGLNRFDRKTQQFTSYQFDTYQNISSICAAKSGELWIAKDICLTKFNPLTGKFTNYFGKHSAYSPQALALIDSLKKQSPALVSITQVGNDENITREFEINKPIPVLIVAVGEGIANELVDTGWLEDTAKSQSLWKMEMEKTKHAGGAFRNRMQLAVISLNPGEYQLHYQSNSEHSYKAWTSWSPGRPELWGISIFPISRKEALKIKSFLEIAYYSSLVGIEGGDVVYVYEDRSEVLWCVLRGVGLFQFDKKSKQFTPYEIYTGELIFEEISLLYEDRSGALWFGTTGKGLIKRAATSDHTAKKQTYNYIQYRREPNNPNSLSSNTITAIFEDKKGFLWIGTDTGLNKFDPQTNAFLHFRKQDGLPSDLIYGILEDNKNNLWISTNRGLSKLNPQMLTFKNYAGVFGEQSRVLWPAAFVKSTVGEIFFVGMSGFTAFYPDSVEDNPYIPPVVITDFQIFNKSVRPGRNSPLKKSIFATKEIILSHNQEVITFEFAALDFTHADNNKYAYKMEGINPDWVYTDASHRFATYTKLDAGEYVFRAKGSNSDGVWNEEGAAVRIIITPPWWKTRWAYVSYVSMLIALVFGIIRLEVNRHKRKAEARLREEQERRRLEEAEHRAVVAELQARAAEAQKEVEKEQMRSRIAGDLHDEIGSNLSSIALISQMLGKKLKLAQPEKHRLQDIPRIARSTAESMRDIIWFINPDNDSMEKLMVKMRETANLMLESFDFTFLMPEAGLAFDADIDFRRNLYLIYKEILQNIIKHAQATKVEIDIGESNKCFRLRVADNGVGFDTTKEYLGDGLKNFKRRAAEMGGTVEVASSKGNGTIVTLTVRG